VAGRTVYSLAFILSVSVGFALLKPQPTASRGVEATPVHHARGGETLWIDANLDGYGVAFQHETHQKRNGGKASCAQCHHMNLPRDRNSGCHQCHRDMYLASDAFRHGWHASSKGGQLACVECHRRGETRGSHTAKPCVSCHKDLLPAGAVIQIRQYRAAGYVEALHQLCNRCHAGVAAEQNRPEMTRCSWCHKGTRDYVDAEELASRKRRSVGKHIVLPPIATP